MPALNALAARAIDGTSTFGDRVHFVHIYVVEPHPKAPDPSPYSGVVWEAQYSSMSQPRTFDQRCANARDTQSLLAGRQLTLVDDLTAGSTNPAWCTYGTCPNCAFLIRQDGTVDTVQTWVDATAMERAIRTLLGVR